MKKDSINTIAVIGLLGTIILESFIIGQSQMIEYFILTQFPLVYPVYTDILTVIMVGFLVFFLLGVITLEFSEDEEE